MPSLSHTLRVMPRRNTVLVMLSLGLAACSGTTDNPPDNNQDTTPAAVAIASGNNQSGDVGMSLGADLVVVVQNGDGDGIANVTVAWSVIAGGGMLASATSTTSSGGQATNMYTLGSTAGTNTVRATVQGTAFSIDFTATANAPDTIPASITIVSGDNQYAEVSTDLAEPLVVVVRNAGGTALDNVDVAWSVTAGGGSVPAGTVTTDGSGEASNVFTVSSTEESSTIEASVQSNPAVTVSFTATAVVISSGEVSVNDNSFNPEMTAVAQNSAVTWTWSGSNQHNVTFVTGGLSNSMTQAAGSHMVTFTEKGAFDYYCTIHGTPTSGMRGTIIVP